ncbi:MAG: hypothetical protein J5871_00780, partial [Bacteroidales bacterium]|nr:hypothetical protein [Bacteroidales bacterium]
MRLLILMLAALSGLLPAGTAWLKQLQPRDSILVADQLAYGFTLDSLDRETMIALPDFTAASNDTLTLVRGWKLDTVRRKGVLSVSGSIVLAPFEEGRYLLPPIPVVRQVAGRSDTLFFEGVEMDVKAIPVDTATFVIRDLKGQIHYPLTFAEVFPWVGGGLLAAVLLAGLVFLLVRHFRRGREGEVAREPAYLVALRQLEKFRGDKFWAPDRQKAYYSGITDALKAYIDERFGVDAPEMTTAELFAALKSAQDITPELFTELRELFECADFVKFAKYTATEEQNAKALPLAVRFVTSTSPAELEG